MKRTIVAICLLIAAPAFCAHSANPQLAQFGTLRHGAQNLIARGKQLDADQLRWGMFTRDQVYPWYEAESAYEKSLDPKSPAAGDLMAAGNLLYQGVSEMVSKCNPSSARIYLRAADEITRRARLELAGQDDAAGNMQTPLADQLSSNPPLAQNRCE